MFARGHADRDYPTQAWLVVEVADSSLADDRGWKAEIYAQAAVPEYWVVDLRHACIEVYTEPDGARWRRMQAHGRGEAITPLAGGESWVDVAEVCRCWKEMGKCQYLTPCLPLGAQEALELGDDRGIKFAGKVVVGDGEGGEHVTALRRHSRA